MSRSRMTATKRHSNFPPEDYLEIERMSLLKHEYFQGQLVAMAGASKAHVIVTGNLSASLVNPLIADDLSIGGDRDVCQYWV
jgi:Uma2 family endonuclease